MADSIDKSVVDTKTTVELPGAEEVIQDQQEKIEKVQSIKMLCKKTNADK